MKRQAIFRGQWNWHLPRSVDHPGIWPFIWWANIQATVAAANSHIPVLLSGGLISPSAAAFVKVCQELAAILTKPATVLADVIYPELARLISRQDFRAVRHLMVRSVSSAVPIAALIVVLLSLVAEPVLVGLFGAEYGVAGGLLRLMLIGAGIQAGFFVFEPVLYSMVKAKQVFCARFLATSVQITLIAYFATASSLEVVGYAAISYATTAAVLLGVFAMASVSYGREVNVN